MSWTFRPAAPFAAALAIGLSAGLTYAAWPQGRQSASGLKPMPPTKLAAAPEKAKTGGKITPWSFIVGAMTYNDTTGENELEKVVATSDQGTVIHADHWKGNDKAKTGQATGNLKMTDPQADATADLATMYYGKGKRLLVLTGNVDILLKPKKKDQQPTGPPGPAPVVVKDGQAKVDEPAPQSSEDEDTAAGARSHPATVTCDKVEYEYARNKKHAVLTGHFKIVQKLKDNTRTLTASYADWFGLEDRILLHGPVHMEDTKGRVFDTKEDVPVSVKEGDEHVEFKNGTGRFEVHDDDTGDDDTTASPAATTQPAKPTKLVKPTQPAKPGQAGH